MVLRRDYRPGMTLKRHTVDQIVAKLRKADIEIGRCKRVPRSADC